MGTHILVPTDGSDHAERAFDHALRMADNAGGELHLLHVVDTDRYGEPALSSSELVITEQEDEGSTLLKRLAVLAGQRGVPTSMDQCHGDPVDEILDCIEHDDIDTVVMGRQGFDHRRSLGSVAERVLRQSPAEVVLV